MRCQRHPRTHVTGDLRCLFSGAHDQIEILDAFHLQRQSGKGERVARRQRGGEAFLDLAQIAAIAKSHIQHWQIDDDTRVKPVLRNEFGMRDPPNAVRTAHQFLKLIIRPQRVSAGRYELQHVAKCFRCNPAIGQRRLHFIQHARLIKWRGAGAGHDMLRQYVQSAAAKILAVAHALVHRIIGRLRLQIFETIARHQNRL